MLEKMLDEFTVFVSNLSPRLSEMQRVDIASGLFTGTILISEGEPRLCTPYFVDRTIYFPEVFLNFLWAVCYHVISTTEELVIARRRPDYDGWLSGTPEIDQAVLMKEWALSLRFYNSPWPIHVCDPYSEGKYQYMVGLVFKNALAFILFHEYAHGKLQHSAKAEMSVLLEQEREADNFALQTVYDEILDEDERRAYLFGVICAGVAMMYAVTDPKQITQESHPDIDVRLFNFVEFFNLPESNERRYVHLLLTVALRGFINAYGLEKDRSTKFGNTWDHVLYLVGLIEGAKNST